MVVSEKYKYVFIEVAKTASTSMRNFLLENDPTAKSETLLDEGGNSIETRLHLTATQLRKLLGVRYMQYSVVAFTRDPFSTIVSNYFFYRNGRPCKLFRQMPFGIKLRVCLAKIIPFTCWAAFYPYRLNWTFVSEGEDVIVDYLGRFHKMEEDFFTIFDQIGVNFQCRELPKVNASAHKDVNEYYKQLLKRFVKFRTKKDLKLMEFAEALSDCRVESAVSRKLFVRK
jgi:hypothetical protein